MGYEIAGGLGVKLAAPDRDVFVLVGDGSYLMMAQELLTAVQERVKLTVRICPTYYGFASIGALSDSIGSVPFGSPGVADPGTGQLSGEVLPLTLRPNAASLGVVVLRAWSSTSWPTPTRTCGERDRPYRD